MRKILLLGALIILTSSCGLLDKLDGSQSSSSDEDRSKPSNFENTPKKSANGVKSCLMTDGKHHELDACTELSGNYPADCLDHGKEIVACPAGFTQSCSFGYKTYYYYIGDAYVKSHSKEQCENLGGTYTDYAKK